MFQFILYKTIKHQDWILTFYSCGNMVGTRGVRLKIFFFYSLCASREQLIESISTKKSEIEGVLTPGNQFFRFLMWVVFVDMKCVMYGLLSPVTPSQTAGSRSKLALMSAQLSVYFYSQQAVMYIVQLPLKLSN